jgi:hypothetical protein
VRDLDFGGERRTGVGNTFELVLEKCRGHCTARVTCRVGPELVGLLPAAFAERIVFVTAHAACHGSAAMYLLGWVGKLERCAVGDPSC